MTQATSTSTTGVGNTAAAKLKPTKTPEEIWAELQGGPGGAGDLYGQAMTRASERLANPDYDFDPAETQQVIDFYSTQYEDAAQKRLGQAQGMLRQYGLVDSGRHAEAIMENERRLNSEIASNVTVPMLLEDRKLIQEYGQKAIDTAATLGKGWYEMGLSARDQAMAEDTQARTNWLAERAQVIQEQQAGLDALIAEADATGMWGDIETLEKQKLALEREKVSNDWQIETTKLQMTMSQFLTEQTGIVGSTGQLDANSLGINVSQAYRPDGTRNSTEYFRVYDMIEEAAAASNLNMTSAQIDALIKGEPVFIRGGKTLAQQAHDLEVRRLDIEEELETARLTGDLDGEATLDAQRLAIETELERTRIATQASQFITTQTGIVGGGGKLTAMDLGVDVSAVYGADGKLDREELARVSDLLEAAFGAAGMSLSNRDVENLVKGKSIATDGILTLDARRLSTETAFNLKELSVNEALQNRSLDIEDAQLDLQEKQQQIDERIAYLELTGRGTDPVTGQTIESLAAQRLALDKQIEIADRTGHFSTTVKAADFGISVEDYLNADGTVKDMQKFFEAADIFASNFKAIYGRDLLPTEAQALARGQTIGVSYDTLQGVRTYAELTGYVRSPETGQLVRTIAGQTVDTDKIMAQTDQTRVAQDYQKWQADLLQRKEEWKDSKGFTDRELKVAEAALYAELTGVVMDPTTGKVMVYPDGPNVGKPMPTADALKTLAEQTGMVYDPRTKKLTKTLGGQEIDIASERNDIEREQLSQEYSIWQQEFSQKKMEWKRQYSLDERQANLLQAQAYSAMTGFAMDPETGEPMLNPDGTRMSTLDANTRYAALTGMIVDPITGQAVRTLDRQALDLQDKTLRQDYRKFNLELAQRKREWGDKYELDEREVTALESQITAKIAHDTAILEQQAIQFAATNNLNWAELMGTSNASGEMGLEDFGIAFEETTTLTQKTKIINDAFAAQGMGTPTAEQLGKLLHGEKIAVQNSPTLAARNLSAQVSGQALDRAADTYRFAEQYDLDERKFEQSNAEMDRQFALNAKTIADQHQLDQQQFSLAQMQVMAEMTGRTGVDGRLTASMLGVSMPEYDEATREQFAKAEMRQELGREPNFEEWSGRVRSNRAAERTDAEVRVTEAFRRLQGREPTPAEVITLLDNEAGLPVNSSPTFQAQQQAAAQEAAARAYGLDVQKFTEASSQFDDAFAEQKRQGFIASFGYDPDDESDDPAKTMQWQSWNQAYDAFATSESNRDMAWSQLLRGDVKNEEQRGARYDEDPAYDGWNNWTLEQFNEVYSAQRGNPPITQSHFDQLRARDANGNYVNVVNMPYYSIGKDEMSQIVAFLNGAGINMGGSQGTNWGGIGQLVGSVATIASTIYGNRPQTT